MSAPDPEQHAALDAERLAARPPAGDSVPRGRPSQAREDVVATISDGLSSLLSTYYGRGPDSARAYYQDDLVACVLRGGFTRVEQTLLEAGRGQAVIDQRMEFQELMRQRFADVVEQATGRTVIGFMSGNQQSPDMICELFILEGSDLIKRDKRQSVTARTPDRSGGAVTPSRPGTRPEVDAADHPR